MLDIQEAGVKAEKPRHNDNDQAQERASVECKYRKNEYNPTNHPINQCHNSYPWLHYHFNLYIALMISLHIIHKIGTQFNNFLHFMYLQITICAFNKNLQYILDNFILQLHRYQILYIRYKMLIPVPNLLKYELSRLQKKSYGLILSIITFSFYFTYYPDLLALIWPTLLKTMPEIYLFIAVLAGINVVALILYSGTMWVIYRAKWPFFQQFRISQEPWPWQTDYQSWKKLLKRSIKNIALNALLVGPILVFIDCHISFQVKMSMDDIPQSRLTYLWQFYFFLIFQQIWNYLMHALLHQPLFYWIHKPHHQYTIPVSIAGQHLHPIEYIISSSLSTGLGYKILVNFYPVHIFSLIIWMTFRVIETNDSHAGYNWPWIQSALIPFNSGDNYHYFHHKINVGNYAGIMYFMDSFFGTNKTFWNYEAKALAKQSNKDEKQS